MESQLGKPPILPITVKLLFTNSFSYSYRQGWYYTLFTINYWKEATTPCFVIYNWQDATTPYLPASIGRRIQPPSCLLLSLAPPYHPNMILVIFQIPLPFKICHTHWSQLLLLWSRPRTLFLSLIPLCINTSHFLQTHLFTIVPFHSSIVPLHEKSIPHSNTEPSIH